MRTATIQMGEFRVADGGENLATSGIGSCLAVVLYDPMHQIGGLAHAMLPTRSRSAAHLKCSARYVDMAVRAMLRAMLARGAQKDCLEAKIVGGANMFPGVGSDVGRENVSRARETLKQEHVRLVGEAVGGTVGRSLEFCVASGVVTVETRF